MRTLYFQEQYREQFELPYHVKGMGVWFEQLTTLRPNGLSDYQLVYCNDGSGIVRMNGKEHKINPHMGFFTSPYDKQEYFATEKSWLISYIIFNGFGVAPLLEQLKIPHEYVFHSSNPFYIESYFNELYTCVKARKPNWVTESSVVLYAMLSNLNAMAPVHQKAAIEAPYTTLETVIAYLDEHYSENITLQDLAALIDVTPAYFCQLFKKTYNTRPFNYLNHLRIEKAKILLLKYPTKPVFEISRAVGYEDTSYFCRLFKSIAGISPSNFRKRFHE